MNIESILSKIDLFEELVIKSGFKRDIQDFATAVQQPQNKNLVFMKGLSETIKSYIVNFDNNSLHSDLKVVLKDSSPFTNLDTIKKLTDIDTNTEIDANTYFAKFNSILNGLNKTIAANEVEINLIKNIFGKYVDDATKYENAKKQAFISLIFKDIKTTSSIKEFSKVLNRWNTTLLLYHTLLKSESPTEISLVEIQNGSIDVIFNIDLDIAIDLTEIIKTGLKVYGAYLLYKTKLGKEMISSFMGNKKLIELEKKKEILYLENIKESMKLLALEQHTEKLKHDQKIEIGGAEKKADEISKIITDHIIKGNEIKFLNPPQIEETEETEDNPLLLDLRESTAIVRERFKNLPQKDKILLLEKFSIENDEVANKKK